MRKKQKPPKLGIVLVTVSVICFVIIGIWAGIEMNQQPPDPASMAI